MSKYTRNQNTISDTTQQEALELTQKVLKPSELKAHRKLVEQGIQKGIDLYKKQNKAKLREIDKRLKRVSSPNQINEEIEAQAVVYKSSRLSWILLACSWILFAIQYFLSK